MKKVFLTLLILIVILSFAACDKEIDPNLEPGEIDTPLEGMNYFYQSLALALQAESAEISISTEFNGEPEMDAEVLIKKAQGGVILYERDNVRKAYYNGRAYYGNNYSLYADISLPQFLTILFNEIYEVEFNYFLYSNDFTLIEHNGGYKLTATSIIFPHTYSMELITDASHKFVSAHFISEVVWFTRDIYVNLSNNIPSGVPLPTTLPQDGTDRTETINNVNEIAAAMYSLIMTSELKKITYKSEGSEGSYEVDETYRISETKAKLDYIGGYDYYSDGRLYSYISDFSPDFLQKVYEEMPISNFKNFLFSQILYNVRTFDISLAVTKTVDGASIRYESDSFYCIINGGELDYFVLKEVMWDDSINYTKHDFMPLDYITEPNGFVASSFISYFVANDLAGAKFVLDKCIQTMHDKFLYHAANPSLSEYATALNNASISIVTSAPQQSSMILNYYYIEEIPSTEIAEGSITAVYLATTRGIYKVYYSGDIFVYDILD